MRAVLFPTIERLMIGEVPDPVLTRNDEILLKVEVAGICATDVHIYHGHFPVPMPVVPGHEFAGTILEVGPGVKSLRVGDRVAVDPASYCGRCLYCRTARRELCEHFEGNGNTRPGGFAPLTVIREDQAFPIGDLELDVGAFAEPLACAVHAVKVARPAPFENVLILGGGLHGQMLAQVARTVGAGGVVLADPNEEKLHLATTLGAKQVIRVDRESLAALSKAGFEAFDVIIDTTAKQQVLEGALEFLAPGGRLILYGVPTGGMSVSIDPWEIFRREAQIIGVFAGAYEFDEALAMLRDERVRVGPLISHRFSLEEFGEAFNVMLSRGYKQKVMIYPH